MCGITHGGVFHVIQHVCLNLLDQSALRVRVALAVIHPLNLLRHVPLQRAFDDV